MRIIPIEFTIAASELTKLNPEDVEAAIKKEISDSIMESISPMLDEEGFIDMIPSEDGTEFEIKINMMIGSTAEYIDATSDTTKLIISELKRVGAGQTLATTVAQNATKPLVDLVR